MNGKDRAVSPVIGVILMVAITVGMAAVIAAFVFGASRFVDEPLQKIVIKDKCMDSDGYYRIVYDIDGEINTTAMVKETLWNKSIVGETYYAKITSAYRSGIVVNALLTEDEYNNTCEKKGYKC